MKYLIPLIALGLLCGCGDKKESASKASSSTTTGTDSATIVEDAAEDDDLPSSIGELIADFDTKSADARQKMKSASTEAEKNAVFQTAPKGHRYASKVMRLIENSTDDSEKLSGLVFAAKHGFRDGVNVSAVDQLIEGFAGEEKVAAVCGPVSKITDPEVASKTLRKIVDGSENKTAKGVAQFVLGKHLEKQGARDQAAVLYEQIVNEHETLTFEGADVLAGVKRSLKSMEALLALAIGKVAPDITANDLDGKEFNLSDYRGKVVLLDFWGDW